MYYGRYRRRHRHRHSRTVDGLGYPSPNQVSSSPGVNKNDWPAGGNGLVQNVRKVPWYHHLTHLPGYNYCGPFTTKHGLPPTNSLDARCMNHDGEYEKLGVNAYFTNNKADRDLIAGIRKDRKRFQDAGFYTPVGPHARNEVLDGALVEFAFRMKQAIGGELKRSVGL